MSRSLERNRCIWGNPCRLRINCFKAACVITPSHQSGLILIIHFESRSVRWKWHKPVRVITDEETTKWTMSGLLFISGSENTRTSWSHLWSLCSVSLRKTLPKHIIDLIFISFTHQSFVKGYLSLSWERLWNNHKIRKFCKSIRMGKNLRSENIQ